MEKLTRKEYAEAVLAQLRGVGPQTVEQIQHDLRLTKRVTEDALWLLASSGRIEYGETQAPLVYIASS